MRETQKAKIERLEAENLTLKAELSALYEKYNALLANSDNAATGCGNRKISQIN